MKKVILLILAILIIVSLSYYNEFVVSNDKATPLEFTEEETLLLEEASKGVFTIADVYHSSVVNHISTLFKENYDINLRVKPFINIDKMYEALGEKEIDFAFDVTNIEESKKGYEYYESTEYINIKNALYFDKEKTDIEDKDKTVLCRTIEKCNLFTSFGIPFKDMEVESNLTSIMKKMSEEESIIFFDTDYSAPLFLRNGYHYLVLDEAINFIPSYIVTAKEENKKFLELFKKIYTSKDFTRALKMRLIEADSNAKIHFLIEYKEELDTNKTYKVFFNDLYPFAYHEDGRWKGAYVDVVKSFFEDMGLKYQVINLDKELPEGEYLLKLFYDEIDVITPLGVVESRKKEVLFSDTEHYVDLVAIKRDSYKEEYYAFNEMYDEVIGIFNTGVDYELPTSIMAGKKFVVYNTYDELFEALKNKDINYVICTKKYFEQYRNKTQEFSLVVDEKLGIFGGVSVVIGFNNSDQGHVLREAFSYWSDEDLISRQIEQIDSNISPIKYYKQREYIINTLFLIMIALIASIAVVFFTMSRYDSLTKVKNRHAFNNDFRKVIPQGHTLIYVDLNKFKMINDTYGHSSGDLVLVAFANKSRKYSGMDMYRIGGDEFVIIVNNQKNEVPIAEIIDDFQSAAVVNPEKDIVFKVSASLGHLYLEKPIPVNLALEYVDYAMYRAKSDETTVVDVSDSFIAEIDAERKVISRITDAFEQQKISIKFNPVVDVKTKKIETFMVDQYWKNGPELEHIEKRIDFIRQIGLIERLDSINLNLIIGAYNQIIHEESYKDQTFTVSMTESTFERTVKNVIGENKAIDSFFANQLVIRIENAAKLSKVSSALLQEFSKRGVMVHLKDLTLTEDIIDLMASIKHLYIMVDKKLLIDSSEQYLLYNSMTDKINTFKDQGAKLLVTGVESRVDYAKVNQFDIDFVSGEYISKQLELEELKTFLENEPYKYKMDVRKKVRN